MEAVGGLNICLFEQQCLNLKLSSLLVWSLLFHVQYDWTKFVGGSQHLHAYHGNISTGKTRNANVKGPI